MIKVEVCGGCGRNLFTQKVANLDVRCEVEAVDAQEAVAALVAGRELWRLTQPGGLNPVRPVELNALRTAGPGERPTIVKTHRCTALSRPFAAPKVPSVQPTPQSPPAGRTAPSSGPSAGPSSVPGAETPDSDPVCDRCGQACADPGTYWGIQHGTAWVHAEHVTCP